MDARRVRLRELAAKLGVSVPTVAFYANGRRSCPMPMRIALSVVTVDIERALGIADPTGLPVDAWSEAAANCEPVGAAS